jgi:hypothetical protein
VIRARDPTQDVGQGQPVTYPGQPGKAADAPRRAPKSSVHDGSADQVASGKDRVEDVSHRFGDLLRSPPKRRSRDDTSSPSRDHQPGGVPQGPSAALAAGLTRWFRAESSPTIPRPQSVRQPLPIAVTQRVLWGLEGANRQAQIQISGGKLAGSQIHLALAGTRIEAQLLTSSEASRQTLLTAMDRLRDRLRARGIIVSSAPSSGHRDPLDEDSPTRSRRAGPGDRERGR